MMTETSAGVAWKDILPIIVLKVVERKLSPEPKYVSMRGESQKGKEHVGYCVVSVPSSVISQSFFFSASNLFTFVQLVQLRDNGYDR
jgi:hypothetical protein